MHADNTIAGQEVHQLRPGEVRPRLDYAKHGYRTNKDDFGLFAVKTQWGLAARSVTETFKATFFPNVMWVIALNSIFVGALSATQQNAAAIILGLKLNFNQLGLVVLPIVVATPFVWFFGGFLADKISNWQAKRNGGQREPESHLISLAFPLMAGIAGPLLFGYAGEHTDQRPLAFLLGGFFLIGFGGLTMNTLVSVYLVESYPNYAGYVPLYQEIFNTWHESRTNTKHRPVLVTMSSFRLIAGFLISFKSADMILAIGFLKTFGIYAAIMGLFSLMLPIVYKYGKRMRLWSAGKLDASSRADDDDRSMKSIELTRTWTVNSGKM